MPFRMREDVIDSLIGDESILLSVTRATGLQTVFLGLDGIILAHVLLCTLIHHLQLVDALNAERVVGVM